jgi:hypothetical protein
LLMLAVLAAIWVGNISAIHVSGGGGTEVTHLRVSL